MEAKHTPGPWRVEYPHIKGASGTERTSRVAGVAHAYKDTATFEANARLIAAAPELLEALQAVTKSTEWSCMERDIQDAVTAAIAKATGGEA